MKKRPPPPPPPREARPCSSPASSSSRCPSPFASSEWYTSLMRRYVALSVEAFMRIFEKVTFCEFASSICLSLSISTMRSRRASASFDRLFDELDLPFFAFDPEQPMWLFSGESRRRRSCCFFGSARVVVALRRLVDEAREPTTRTRAVGRRASVVVRAPRRTGDCRRSRDGADKKGHSAPDRDYESAAQRQRALTAARPPEKSSAATRDTSGGSPTTTTRPLPSRRGGPHARRPGATTEARRQRYLCVAQPRR
mmetsp:Transcript_15965/g.64427  ORF Transcript_15965/g.64427 Transcript_15965/m.64427 type:complete len:254 (-) Transcript_15965:9-770(-)